MKRLLGIALALWTWVLPATAQTNLPQPGQPLTIIVPFAAGGSTDAMVRLIADRLQVALKRSVVIQNIGGAGSTIGLGRLARAKPDGLTIGVGTTAGMVVNPLIKPHAVAYKPLTDFEPITRFTESYQIMVVNPKKLPVENVSQLIAYLKAHPRQVSFGTPGIGTNQQLAVEQFQMLTGTQMIHIPYTSSSQVLTDLIGGRIGLTVDQVPQLLPHVKNGSLRVLGYTGTHPPAFDPSIKPIGDTVQGFQMMGWHGFFAPAHTPPAIVNELSTVIREFMARPETIARFESLGVIAASTTPQQLTEFMTADIARTRPIVTKTGMVEQ